MISSFSICNGDLLVIGFSPAIKPLGAEEMIHTKDHQTAYIFDPWHFLGRKRPRLMDESWAALFRALCRPGEPGGPPPLTPETDMRLGG